VLPVRGNGPQRVAYGLYAEQLSGTAFTCPRATNQRTWLYRIRPSVGHTKFESVPLPPLLKGDTSALKVDPAQMRWGPIPAPVVAGINFVVGLTTMGGSGDPTMKEGIAVHVYSCNASMGKTVFSNADGDYLIVPQQGVLLIRTELGRLHVSPHEIAVIQRGIKFSVDIVEGVTEYTRGYVLEVYGGHYELPDLGPIGANGLANPRDFKTPVAWYEDVDEEHILLNKFGGYLFRAVLDHSPFDVVGWHGNYAPYKYNLDDFCCMNSVTFDHPDPSIYTVLTCKTNTPGVAAADFVIFPPRWMVMEDTFRPPYYHRNTMSEFMGMIYGKYDAKVGFVAGGASLHSCMSPHGPDRATFVGASTAELKPEHFEGGLAFMFETTYVLKLSEWALTSPHREVAYSSCWDGLPKLFDPTNPHAGLAPTPRA